MGLRPARLGPERPGHAHHDRVHVARARGVGRDRRGGEQIGEPQTVGESDGRPAEDLDEQIGQPLTEPRGDDGSRREEG